MYLGKSNFERGSVLECAEASARDVYAMGVACIVERVIPAQRVVVDLYCEARDARVSRLVLTVSVRVRASQLSSPVRSSPPDGTFSRGLRAPPIQ